MVVYRHHTMLAAQLKSSHVEIPLYTFLSRAFHPWRACSNITTTLCTLHIGHSGQWHPSTRTHYLSLTRCWVQLALISGLLELGRAVLGEGEYLVLVPLATKAPTPRGDCSYQAEGVSHNCKSCWNLDFEWSFLEYSLCFVGSIWYPDWSRGLNFCIKTVRYKVSLELSLQNKLHEDIVKWFNVKA